LLPLSVLESSDSLGEPALGACSGVLVHGALGDGGVDALDSHLQLLVGVVGASFGCFDHCPGAGADLSTDSPVAVVALLVLSVALDRTLDICHCEDLDTCSTRRYGPADKATRLGHRRNPGCGVGGSGALGATMWVAADVDRKRRWCWGSGARGATMWVAADVDRKRRRVGVR